MKPYSQDLRERVASACAQPGQTIGQVAVAFSVSTAFVNKLLRRQRTTGSVAARPHTGGPTAKLDAVLQAQLVAWVGGQPDITLAELQAALVAHGGPAVSLTLIWQVLTAHGLRRKKRVSTPPNATRSE
jgi:transposase